VFSELFREKTVWGVAVESVYMHVYVGASVMCLKKGRKPH